MDRHRAAWVGVGLLLDFAAVLALVPDVLTPVDAPAYDTYWSVLHPAGALAILALVHALILPALIWPARRITRKDAGWAAVIAMIALPVFALAGLLGAVTGVYAGNMAPWDRLFGEVAMTLAFLAINAFAWSLSFAIVADVSSRGTTIGWVRANNSAQSGGAVAGFVLAGAFLLSLGTAGDVLILNIWTIVPLAGLPHLLLLARSLPLGTMASPAVAIRRAGAVVAVLAAIGLAIRLIPLTDLR